MAMPQKHDLFARNELSDIGNRNRILAVDENRHRLGLEGYRVVGQTEGLTERDFGHDNYWEHRYIDIHLIGSLKRSASRELSDRLAEEVRTAIKTDMANKHFLERGLRRLVTGVEVVEGDLYLVRITFQGEPPPDCSTGIISRLYLSSPNDGQPSIADNISKQDEKKKIPNQLVVKGDAVNLDHYLQRSGSGYVYWGKDVILSLERVGTLSVPRLNLSPFKSYSPTLTPYRNNACLVLAR